MPETDGGMAFRLQLVRHNQYAIVVRCDYFAIAVPADDGASFLDQLHPRIVVGPSEDIAFDGMRSRDFNVFLVGEGGFV